MSAIVGIIIGIIFVLIIFLIYQELKKRRINIEEEEIEINESDLKNTINKPILWYLGGDKKLLDQVNHHTIFVFTRLSEKDGKVNLLISPTDCRELKKGKLQDINDEYTISIDADTLFRFPKLSPHRDIWLCLPNNIVDLDKDLAGTLFGQVYLEFKSKNDLLENIIRQKDETINSLNTEFSKSHDTIKMQSKRMSALAKEAQFQQPQRQFGENQGGTNNG